MPESGEMKLSVDRANAIVDALVKRGIARNKFITKGSGSTKPVADNSTPEGKAQNRRVEITILE
ncbi:MAG: OmpA family protein [Treponema sp.]|nr:OmpA family protein [Treponema sp.]